MSDDPNDLANAIRASASHLGVNPVDLGTAISYETGGTFDPWKAGPGGHRGLIQWGEPEQAQYGVHAGMPNMDQMLAVEKYLTNAGVKPGMGMLDLYSAINAGRVGMPNASDAANGGAPGTVADKVSTMAPHQAKALALLGGQTGAPGQEGIYDDPTLDRMAPVSPLAAQFSNRVKELQLDLQDQGIGTKLISGYRSPEDQARLVAHPEGNPVAPPGSSFHNYGLAVDMVPTGDYASGNAAMVREERSRPWFTSGADFHDPNHIQSAGVSMADLHSGAAPAAFPETPLGGSTMTASPAVPGSTPAGSPTLASAFTSGTGPTPPMASYGAPPSGPQIASLDPGASTAGLVASQLGNLFGPTIDPRAAAAADQRRRALLAVHATSPLAVAAMKGPTPSLAGMFG